MPHDDDVLLVFVQHINGVDAYEEFAHDHAEEVMNKEA